MIQGGPTLKCPIWSQVCTGDSDIDDNVMLDNVMLERYVGDIFLHVGDMPIGHQHDYMSECDVEDRFVMLETFF